MAKGKEEDLLISELKKGINKRSRFLRAELRRIVLTRYLKKAGCKGSDIEGLLKCIRINFWSAVGYSKAVSDSLKLTPEQRAVIWSMIQRLSKTYGDQY